MVTVALDSEHTRHSHAGVARYATGLAHALRELPDIRVIELGGGDIVPRGTLRKKILTARHDLLWYPVLAARLAAKRHADVYHAPLLRGPLRKPRLPFVMTVHDMVPVLYPETMPLWHRTYTGLVMRRLLDSADRLITPSQDTADDVNRLARVSADKIRVVPNGIDQIFFDYSLDAKMKSDGELPYVLFVGTPEPRKNLRRLVRAMRMLRERGFPERLVVVGAHGWGISSDLGEGEIVKALGRVGDRELVSLYAGASCLALPSLHEGFGLPAIEAMAVGTPVVAANTGALPEVTGGAAVLVNPERESGIADGIALAIADRHRLSAAGKLRAREFTWAKAAEATAAVYRELL